jgi:hypothetical protein
MLEKGKAGPFPKCVIEALSVGEALQKVKSQEVESQTGKVNVKEEKRKRTVGWVCCGAMNQSNKSVTTESCGSQVSSLCPCPHSQLIQNPWLAGTEGLSACSPWQITIIGVNKQQELS